MKTIRQVYHIDAPAEKVWQALVDPKVIDAWGGGPAKMSAKEGYAFKLWGGDVHGTNLKVEDRKKLVQEWFSGDWEHASIVTFTMIDEKGKTRVDLLHENVPEDEAADIEEGWNIYYLGEIKKLLEKSRS